MRGLILLLISCCFVGICFAQDITVTGQIIDGSTRKPISFADIILEKAGVGTVSNEDGAFTLIVPAEFQGDTVKITHIGYGVYVNTLPGIQELRKPIELTLAPKVLDEVVVRPMNGVDIAKNAFGKVADNYSQIPYGMKAFFRGSVEVDGRVIELVEAQMDIKYAAYNGDRATFDIRPMKGRRVGTADSCEAFRMLPASSHVDDLFYEDLLHKRRTVLLNNFSDGSDMRVADVLSFDGMEVYEIEFDQKEGVTEPMFKGKMFVDSKSLAVVRVEYGNSPAGAAYDAFNAAQPEVPDSVLHYRHEGYYVTMNYRRRDSTWYLDDVVGSYYYHALRTGSKVKPPIDSRIVLHSELFVTDVDTKHAVSGKLTAVKHRENWIFDKIRNFDPDYWAHVNYIVPSKRINAIADTLTRANQ